MTVENYSINNANIGQLTIWINTQSFSSKLVNISGGDTEIDVCFSEALTPVEKTTLDNYIAGYTTDMKIAIKNIVVAAMGFFNDLIIDFAADNILTGITASGKTKAVADYLQNVMRYGQSGSLYEVANEIDVLIAATVPAELSPYITTTILTEFKTKVTNYLGI